LRANEIPAHRGNQRNAKYADGFAANGVLLGSALPYFRHVYTWRRLFGFAALDSTLLFERLF
jgi:hypothetical protein